MILSYELLATIVHAWLFHNSKDRAGESSYSQLFANLINEVVTTLGWNKRRGKEGSGETGNLNVGRERNVVEHLKDGMQ
jgi:hypothetical protein